MQDLQFGFGGGSIGNHERITSAMKEIPEFAQEAEGALDAIGVPRLALLQGAEEHLVEAQGVGAVLRDDVVGVHHVVLRLGHLLDNTF